MIVPIKNILLLCFLLFSVDIYAQESVLYGRVTKNGSEIEGVFIDNISTTGSSVANTEGIFSIKAKSGDTLVLSHVNMKDLIVFIKKDDLHSDSLTFVMKQITNKLDEVVLKTYPEINAVSLGIVPKKVEQLSMNERRLKTATDFKPSLDRLKFSLKLDPILNAINGRTKRLKRNMRVEQKIEHISFLRENYTDYMKNHMELSDQEIGQLINFAVEEGNLQELIDNGNEARIKFFLHDFWIKLKEKD